MLLEVNDLSCAFAQRPPVFAHVNLRLDAGEALLLQGPSGCGKTTLAQIIAGIIPRMLEARVSGQVLLAGTSPADLPLAERVQTVGLVLQRADRQLFLPTVEDELAFGGENLCLEPAEIARRADEALALCGITQLRPAPLAQLSGGQLHLVACAAVLTLRPRLLIIDETFSQLDGPYRARLAQALIDHKRGGGAVIVIGHETLPQGLIDRALTLPGNEESDAADEGGAR